MSFLRQRNFDSQKVDAWRGDLDLMPGDQLGCDVSGYTRPQTSRKPPIVQVIRRTPTYVSCPDVLGVVSRDEFDNLLNIYENNQSYYRYLLEENLMHLDDIKKYITQLEHWFMCILEPFDDDEVKEREAHKIENRISYYCDPFFSEFVSEPSEQIFKFIKKRK